MEKILRAPAIDASGLVKEFGATRAVDGVDLSVPAGSVYAILGPNGAGKTTIIRILTTLIRPDEGMAQVLGCDVVREADAVRRTVSLTGQFSSVDQDLTGKENLVLVGRLLGFTREQAKERASELLVGFGLSQEAGRRVATYSGGMRRRLDIAASILVPPDVLFLDEPTTGLDPRGRVEVWETIVELVAAGTTVLLTTQYLEEADRLADRIAVIDRGRVIAEGTSAELKASVGSAVLRVRLTDADRRVEAERVLADALGTRVHLDPDPASLSAAVGDAQVAAHGIAGLDDAGLPLDDFGLERPRLDEVFLALTGRDPDEDSMSYDAMGNREEDAA
jgi:ABC-2 type transport system ATP-binding protein